jgi:hypothetical protein
VEGIVHISIIAIDNDGLYIQKDMVLEIKDSNDSPTVITKYTKIMTFKNGQILFIITNMCLIK